jgi:lauroyl/myristoyl acyltransferase
LSIGKFLLNKENLNFVAKNSFKFGKPYIVDEGMKYFEKNSAEVERIGKNLQYMGLPSSGKNLDDTLRGIAVHYFEKLFVLTKNYEMFWIAKNKIETGCSLEIIKEAQDSKKAVFAAQSHFGASYFMSITFMVNGFNIASVGKFPEPVGSMIKNGSETIAQKYGTGKTKLINIADPQCDVAYEMFSTLLRGGILSNVFDENNQFSNKADLLGKKVMGGSGMDIILQKWNDEKLVVVTPFLVRTGEDSYRFELDRHYLNKGNIIQSFYDSLGKRISSHPDQWYFIHELHEAVPE